MITDEQGREWLFKKLHEDGWRYIVADNYDNIYLTNEKPVMFDDVDEVRISSCEKAMGASAFKNILPKLKRNECISIAEELGIVDWSKVKVDTPILVSDIRQRKDGVNDILRFLKDGKVAALDRWCYILGVRDGR